MDASSDTNSASSNLSRQLISVVILVLSGILLYTTSSWNEWFGPEPLPPAVTGQQAHRLWSGARQSGNGWSEAATAYEQLVDAHSDNATYSYRFAYALHAAGEYDRAIEAHRRAASFPSIRGDSCYNLACALALVGRVDEALDELEALERIGYFPNPRAVPDRDPDFDSIRTNPRFIELHDRLDLLQTGRHSNRSNVPSNV